MNTPLRHTLNASLAAAATAGLMTLGLGSAAAHVHVSPDETAAGASSNLTFDFSHGCDAAPTTQVAITLPDELNDATPNAHPGWDVQKVEDKIPLLGDIPLIGRLFRSSVDQHLKRNLVIFVSARLINPAGEAVHGEEEKEEIVETLPVPEVTVPELPLMPK